LLDKQVGIDLEQIRFPAGVKLLCSKDLRDRYLEGLKSGSGEIRGHAVGGLGELARFTDDVIPTILDALKSDKHEYVRRYAASTLAALGKRSATALPTLKAGLQDPDVNIRNAFQAAIDMIENPKEEQPSPEQLKQRQALDDEIHKFCTISEKRGK
jgi:HEAT repeat protein